MSTDFQQAFRDGAGEVLAYLDEDQYRWPTPNSLVVPASDDTGFEVRLVCESYGLYPFAGDWYGPPWDITVWTGQELRRAVMEFLGCVLSPDGKLVVRYSNDQPFKWILRFSSEGEWGESEMGLFFFNWLGRAHITDLSECVVVVQQHVPADVLRRARGSS